MNSFTRILPLNGRHISPFPRNPLSLQHQHSLALRLQYRTKFSKPKIAIKLNAAVPKLGSINDVVLVKRGFARNVLVPMGMGYYVKGKEAELTVTGAKERAAEKKRRMEQRVCLVVDEESCVCLLLMIPTGHIARWTVS